MSNVAIVTGGSLGFGRAVVSLLAEQGWTVLFDGRDGRAVADAAAASGAVGLHGDVTDPAHRRELVEAARRYGRLVLLVNNASTLGPVPLPHLAEYSLEAVRAVMETNVVAPLALIEEALPLLRAHGGAVVNVSSDAAVEAYEGWGGYGASKAALEQLSRVLAEEEPCVRVWCVDPGDMLTRMHRDAFAGVDVGGGAEPEAVAPFLAELVRAHPPSGRIVLRQVGLHPEGSS